jgi:hypothetical protein
MRVAFVEAAKLDRKKIIRTQTHACKHAIPNGNTNDIDWAQIE